MGLQGRENEVRFNREDGDGNLQEVQSVETRDALLERVWTHLPDGRIWRIETFHTRDGHSQHREGFVSMGAPW
jgi:hypothetical protein